MKIHRCRFVAHQPAAIQHIATTPVFYPNPHVAVARANGDIELWNTTGQLHPWSQQASTTTQQASTTSQQASTTTQQASSITDNHALRRSPPVWHCIGKITPRDMEPSVESVVWSVALEHHHDQEDSSDDDSDMSEMESQSSDSEETTVLLEGKHTTLVTPPKEWTSMHPRLFSASLKGTITEYDLETMAPIAQVDSIGGGAIWCLTVSPCQRYLLAGCEDGCVRVYDISGPVGHLEYLRGFERQTGRIVCMAIMPSSTNGGRNPDPLILVTGSNDGAILKWDFPTGRSVSRMSVGRSTRPNEEVLVWNLVGLPYVLIRRRGENVTDFM